jgi:hypothetical protein
MALPPVPAVVPIVSASDPLRPPGWRWERVTQVLCGHSQLSRRRDDEWIRRAVKFRRRRAQCYTPAALAALAEDDYPVYYAHELFHATAGLDKDAARDNALGLLRYAVEARVLARSTPAEIGERSGISPEAVAAYEALFYDIRSRLHQGDWITAYVMTPAVHRGLSSRDYDLLWKLMARYLGVHVLDAYIATFSGGEKQVAKDDVDKALMETQSSKLVRLATTTTQTARITTENQCEILAIYHQWRQLEAQGAAGGGTQDAVTAQLASFCGSMEVRIGKPEDQPGRHGRLDRLDELAFEVPSDRIVRAAIEGTDPEYDAELATLKFPSRANTEQPTP